MNTLYSMRRLGTSYKVRLALAQLRMPYRLVEVDILRGEARTPEFLAKNPNGQVPLLEVAPGRYIAESNAILVHYGKGAEKREAVIWTSHRLRATLGLTSTEAVRFLVAEQSMSSKERDTPRSFKFIADRTDVPIRTLERAAMAIRRDLRGRELAAYDMLCPMFIRDRVIES